MHIQLHRRSTAYDSHTLIDSHISLVRTHTSPSKTWPRWPPQFEQVISIRFMPYALSSCRSTAPGMLSQYAGHPQPESNFVSDLQVNMKSKSPPASSESQHTSKRNTRHKEQRTCTRGCHSLRICKHRRHTPCYTCQLLLVRCLFVARYDTAADQTRYSYTR